MFIYTEWMYNIFICLYGVDMTDLNSLPTSKTITTTTKTSINGK